MHQLIANWTAARIASGTLIVFFVQQIFFNKLLGGRGDAVWEAKTVRLQDACIRALTQQRDVPQHGSTVMSLSVLLIPVIILVLLVLGVVLISWIVGDYPGRSGEGLGIWDYGAGGGDAGGGGGGGC